jgi:hypothetical protein
MLPTRSRPRLFRSCLPISTRRIEVLERLIKEDAEVDRPFIAALTLSKARGALPALEFFGGARRLGQLLRSYYY